MHAEKLVAFVSSPLQALNLVEFAERSGRQIDLVVVGVVDGVGPNSCAQIEAVLGPARPRKVIYAEWLISPRQPFHGRRAILSAVKDLRAELSAGPYEFIVGEYRSAFTWAVLRRLKVSSENIVVVDDGTATLRIDRRRRFAPSREQLRQRLRGALFLAMGVRGAIPPGGLKFFTTYSINDRVGERDVVVHNDYRSLSAELQKLPMDDEHVYVIGGPYGEAMPEALDATMNQEADVRISLELTRFAEEYTGKTAVYMAHRREEPSKLDMLRRHVTVVSPDVPFEIYPRILGRRPRTIVGYYSSLFVTVAELLGNSVEIISLEIPSDLVNDEWRPFVEDVYRYYRSELRSFVSVVERSSLASSGEMLTGNAPDSTT